MRRYLDYNATAPLRPEVIALMSELHALPYNASSIHQTGRQARSHVENARESIAEALSCWPNELTFTASGTEANNTALNGITDRRVLVSAIEHPSILKATQSPELIPVNGSGIIRIDKLEAMLAANPQKALISVMLANNETGIIQPLADICKLAKKYDALVHTDAIQALGKIPVDFTALGVDMMTISAHKFGGPQGVAALIVRNNLELAPLLRGGRQEQGRRAGTENVAAIVGFAKALELGQNTTHMALLEAWLRRMERELAAFAPATTIFGRDEDRLPNTSCLAMPEITSETQLMVFDLEELEVSAGAACSSGRIEPSHVLLAMGVSPEIASCAIRVSGGWNTQEEDVIALANAWKKLYSKATSRQIEVAA